MSVRTLKTMLDSMLYIFPLFSQTDRRRRRALLPTIFSFKLPTKPRTVFPTKLFIIAFLLAFPLTFYWLSH